MASTRCLSSSRMPWPSLQRSERLAEMTQMKPGPLHHGRVWAAVVTASRAVLCSHVAGRRPRANSGSVQPVRGQSRQYPCSVRRFSCSDRRDL